MAYDLGNAYIPPPRGYTIQRAQSPAVQLADQRGITAIATAHNNHLEQEYGTQAVSIADKPAQRSRGRTGRTGREESRLQAAPRRRLLDQPSPGENPMAQDNAFPLFPTKRSVAAATAAASQPTRPPREDPRLPRDASRPPREDPRPPRDAPRPPQDVYTQSARPPREASRPPHDASTQPMRPPRDASRLRHAQPTKNPNLNPIRPPDHLYPSANSTQRPSTADAPCPPPHSRSQGLPNPLPHFRSQDSVHPLPQPSSQSHHQPQTRPQEPLHSHYPPQSRPQDPSQPYHEAQSRQQDQRSVRQHAHPDPHDQRDPYRSPPQQAQPQLDPLPTFSPPYSTSSRPSTSDSANARERPFLPPLDTQVVGDPRTLESPLLSSVTARHRPAIVPMTHAPYEARISQAAHLSNASAYQDDLTHPQQPWNHPSDKHESLGGLYDDYYQDPPRPMNREDEIEAAMPDFDTSSAHKRQPTIDEHLASMRLNNPVNHPQSRSGYQTASSKLNSAKSQPDLRQQTPVQDEASAFDFGFQGQQFTQSPEPHRPTRLPQHPAQNLYHHTQPHREQQRARDPENQFSVPTRHPQLPQHDYTCRVQHAAPMRNQPQPPQHDYGYNGQLSMPEPQIDRHHNQGYDVRADHSGRPLKEYDQSYSNQNHMMPPPDQQRSQSYDEPSPGPPRPIQQQRAFTSDDQAPYHGQPYNGRSPIQQGRSMPNHAMQRGPIPNANMPNPDFSEYMPRGPPGRGPMPQNPGSIDVMPAGSLPNGQARRGPPVRPPPPGSMPPGSLPPGPTPPGSMPHGAMHSGPMHPVAMDVRSQSRGPPSRRPMPGPHDHRNGMPADGRFPPQRQTSGDRAPSAPAAVNGFAPPPPSRHAEHGYGLDNTMGERAPNPRFAMDERSPSAPAIQSSFAPPMSTDRPFGAPLTTQRSAPQTMSGAPQHSRSQNINPDALPSHPVPVRPGLQNESSAQPPKPIPVRNYANNVDASSSSRPQSQPKSHTEDVIVDSGPVTRSEIDILRSKVDANPNDMKTSMILVKKLVEASTVLASENGRLDAKSAAKNSERYVLEAHKRVKKLVAANYPEAMFYLADCHGSGDLGLESDPKQAFSLYQGAAKAGHGAAAYRTAMCCEMGAEEGGGTKRDYHKAVQWYQRAAQLQDVAAMYKMGMILLRGLLGQQRNVGQSVVYLKRAADNADTNNPHAIHELARLHEEGNPDPAISAAVKPDEKYAQKMYMQAAKMGYKQSQFRLGQAFEYGSLGLPVDSRNSIAWYSKAAAQGEHNSELALSGWYLTGAEGILNQSDTEAYLWARKAAMSEPPLAKAMYALGYYIENGIGCPASLEEGKRWYTRAASYKFPKAVERLEEIRKGKAARPQPNQGRLTRSNQKRDEAECIVM
ncbi:HCP-like protein [Aureobasidium subglaciale]|nr:HCP-like protein [Aureobasidium subglaciale]